MATAASLNAGHLRRAHLERGLGTSVWRRFSFRLVFSPLSSRYFFPGASHVLACHAAALARRRPNDRYARPVNTGRPASIDVEGSGTAT